MTGVFVYSNPVRHETALNTILGVTVKEGCLHKIDF